MKTFLLLAFTAVACLAAADDSAAFAKMKTLAGSWKGTGAEGGGNASPVTVKYRVVSGGSVLQETIAEGTDHEMVTMYYMDGPTLKLTHYCVMQNQPRMKLVSSTNGLKFEFEGGSNCSKDGMCMGNALFTMVSKDHLKSRWGMISGGKETGHIDMDLQRAK
jgi:hypothetical protein